MWPSIRYVPGVATIAAARCLSTSPAEGSSWSAPGAKRMSSNTARPLASLVEMSCAGSATPTTVFTPRSVVAMAVFATSPAFVTTASAPRPLFASAESTAPPVVFRTALSSFARRSSTRFVVCSLMRFRMLCACARSGAVDHATSNAAPASSARDVAPLIASLSISGSRADDRDCGTPHADRPCAR